MAKRGRKEKDNWKKKRRQEYLEKKEFRYYIFCEGQATEPKYFQGFKRYIEDNPIYRDMVLIEIEGCQAETMRVIGKAEEYVRENKITKGQIWCVYDKDSFPSSDVNGVVQRAEVLNQKNPDIQYHAAWSNECIEFWFMLHFAYYTANNHRSEYKKFLNEKFQELGIGKYEKNMDDIFETLMNGGRDLTNEFMNSLFNSVMITHWGFYNGNISSLGEFPTGGNIEFLMQLFYGTSIELIRMNNTNEDIKWIDINISGYWILNLSIPENSKDIVEKWRTYKYNKTEMLLCEGKNNLLKSQKFNLLHFFYFLKQSDPNKEELEYKKWIDIALKPYDLRKIEVIQNIVDTMAEIFSGRIYEKVYAYLFEQLIQDHENEEVIGNSYIHDMYNTYRKKRVLYDY